MIKKFKVTERSEHPGDKGKCTYCQQPIGEDHKDSCILVCKKVRYKFSIEFDELVPANWGMDEINFWWSGQGCHCVGNIIDIIKKIDDSEEEGCLCGQVAMGNARVECLSVGEEGFLKE